jgi:hypothetical protein
VRESTERKSGGGEKGINLLYGYLRLLESVGKRNEKGRCREAVIFSEIDLQKFNTPHPRKIR